MHGVSIYIAYKNKIPFCLSYVAMDMLPFILFIELLIEASVQQNVHCVFLLKKQYKDCQVVVQKSSGLL